jgi:hypothetical protein
LEAVFAAKPEILQHQRNIEASIAQASKELDASLAEFHSEADRDLVIRETQQSIKQMIQHQEDDRKIQKEMQGAIQLMLENSVEDRKLAKIRQNNLDIRLGELASSLRSTIQAETDSKIQQAVELGLIRDVITPLEERMKQHPAVTQFDVRLSG